jgi:ABC-type ATPase with predicted acetyltransferase domain
MSQLIDQSETLVRRDPDAGKHRLSLLKDIFVEVGTGEDWKLLHELHYKSANLGIGPRYMRAAIDDGSERGQTIGCMVFTVPKPLDSGRNEVFPHLRPNQGGKDTTYMNSYRMRWINDNLILSSRTVLDTMYRGAGIAYRFKNIAYRMMGMRFVESRSTMSRFNPFSVKAGMRFVKPKNANAFEPGLKFFSSHFKSPVYDAVAIKAEIESMPKTLQAKTIEALRSFYYRWSSMEKSGDNRLNGRSRVDGMELGYLIKQAQQVAFGATVYAVWQNPDWGRPLPARIPLLAFDEQDVGAPLSMQWLKGAK